MVNAEVVRRLPADLAAPLTLVLEDRLTYRDVANRLGLPPELVASRLRDALNMVRQLSATLSPTATPPTAVTDA